jgi:hypothetical protein
VSDYMLPEELEVNVSDVHKNLDKLLNVGSSCYMGAGVLPLEIGALSIQDWYKSE